MLFSPPALSDSFFFLNNCIRPVNTHTHFYCPYCKARTTFILTLQEQLTGHHMFLNCRWQRDRQNYFKAPFVELFYHKQNQNHHKSCLLQAAQEQDKAAIHWRTSTSRRRPTGSSKTPITQPQKSQALSYFIHALLDTTHCSNTRESTYMHVMPHLLLHSLSTYSLFNISLLFTSLPQYYIWYFIPIF